MAHSVAKKTSPAMTAVFRKAVEKVAQEFTDSEQDELGRWLLKAIATDERQWESAFSGNGPGLEKLQGLVRQARARIRNGQTEVLDLKKL
jgi:hypothetical protein